MYSPKGYVLYMYVFWLEIGYWFSILTILVSNWVLFLHSGLELGNYVFQKKLPLSSLIR